MTLIFRHNQYQETSQMCAWMTVHMPCRIENVINFFISCDVALTRICCGTSIMTIWFVIKYTIYFHSISCSVHGRKWYREGCYRPEVKYTWHLKWVNFLVFPYFILESSQHLQCHTFVLHENILCSCKHILHSI